MNEETKQPDPLKRLHATISGRVQGVGFRAYTQRQAVKLGLTGWVRNRWKGTVEVVAEGSETDLDRFLKTLERGPFSGTTRNVDSQWTDATGEFTSFQIRMTM